MKETLPDALKRTNVADLIDDGIENRSDLKPLKSASRHSISIDPVPSTKEPETFDSDGSHETVRYRSPLLRYVYAACAVVMTVIGYAAWSPLTQQTTVKGFSEHCVEIDRHRIGRVGRSAITYQCLVKLDGGGILYATSPGSLTGTVTVSILTNRLTHYQNAEVVQ